MKPQLKTTTSSAAMLALLVTTSFVAPITVQESHAQALPVVDVCTGISLPRSAVTEVIGDVNEPVVGEVEGVVNNITGLLGGVPILSAIGFPTLDIDLTTILADAAAGDPLSVQVLNSDGNIVTNSDDCNVGADNFSLNDEAGISIGGNQISGLGTNGLAATAGEQNAIAFGNNASTSVGADGAIAFGTGALANEDNAVAIGAGSIADRAPQIAYAAVGISDAVSSAGAVSFGAPGQERQLINIAPGSEANDAATVGQVTGAIAEATGNLVAYDDATQASVTLAGTGGTTLTNVADGALDASSSDAVNGSQLFATNQDVASNTTAIATLETDVTNNTASISTNTTNIANIDGRVTVNESDIATLQTDVSTNTTNIVGLDGRVTVNEGDVATLQTNVATNVTNIATNTTAIGNIDARLTVNEQSINDNSSAIQNLIDASTGSSDLTVVNSRITQNENDIVDLDGRVMVNETDIADLQGDVSTNTTNIASIDGRVTVNEGDIATLQGDVSANTSGIVSLDARTTVNEGDIASLDTRVSNNDTDIANLEGRVTVNESNITSLDSRQSDTEQDVASLGVRVTTNEGDIATLEGRVDNIPVGYVDDGDSVTRSDVPTGTVAFGVPGGSAVRVTNVADGTLAAGSGDAVNGGQLFATNETVAANRTDIDANTANIVSISNSLQGSSVAAVQYSDPANPTVGNGGTITNDVTLVGADAMAPVALHNVADATFANDAVNLRQLQTGLDRVMVDSMAYTDARFADLSFNLAELEDDAYAGTAAAMAMAAIPQTIDSGASMVGGAISHYRGETAFGFGFSSAFNDGSAVLRLNGTIDTDGRGGVAAGAGFSF